MADILTPRCPLCDSLPVMVFGGGTQAFCGNDDCSLLTWDPSLSLDDNLLNARGVQMPPMDDGGSLMAEYTAEQIMQGISAALKERDFPAVVALIKMLAVVDPHQAEVVYESMLAVLGSAGESNG